MKTNDAKAILSERLIALIEKKKSLDYHLPVRKQAYEMNISYSSLRDYISGQRNCPVSVLIKLASYYQVTTDFLLGLSDSDMPDRQQ